jgi:hypothetical protein
MAAPPTVAAGLTMVILAVPMAAAVSHSKHPILLVFSSDDGKMYLLKI